MRQPHGQHPLKRGGMVGAVASRDSEHANAYQRRRPETAALYEVVRDNLETLSGLLQQTARLRAHEDAARARRLERTPCV